MGISFADHETRDFVVLQEGQPYYFRVGGTYEEVRRDWEGADRPLFYRVELFAARSLQGDSVWCDVVVLPQLPNEEDEELVKASALLGGGNAVRNATVILSMACVVRVNLTG